MKGTILTDPWGVVKTWEKLFHVLVPAVTPQHPPHLKCITHTDSEILGIYKNLIHLQVRQHPLQPPTSQNSLYFTDKESKAQKRKRKKQTMNPISKGAVIQRQIIQMPKFKHSTFLPLSMLFFGHPEYQFELSDPKQYPVSTNLPFINKHRGYWSWITHGVIQKPSNNPDKMYWEHK